MLHGIARSGTTRGDPELAVDRGQVPVDRARTDDELFSDLGIGEPLCHQVQYLHLAGRQSGGIDLSRVGF